MFFKLWKYKTKRFQSPPVKKLVPYAIVEVLLVMFGILLALEVDN